MFGIRYFKGQPTDYVIRFKGGKVTAEGRELFARHSDRFLLGSDTWVPERWASYSDTMAGYRAWLAQLPWLAHDADREVVAEVGRTYDSNQHLSNAAAHTADVTLNFSSGDPNKKLERRGGRGGCIGGLPGKPGRAQQGGGESDEEGAWGFHAGFHAKSF